MPCYTLLVKKSWIFGGTNIPLKQFKRRWASNRVHDIEAVETSQKKDQRCIYSGDASYHNMLVDDNAEIVTAEKVISYVTESWEGIHELKK